MQRFLYFVLLKVLGGSVLIPSWQVEFSLADIIAEVPVFRLVDLLDPLVLVQVGRLWILELPRRCYCVQVGLSGKPGCLDGHALSRSQPKP